MNEMKCTDIFSLPDSNGHKNIVCVTTNGMIKRDGTAVMGAGIAKTANMRFNVAGKLANSLRQNGNVVTDLGQYNWQSSNFHLVAFPTKENWRDSSLLWLIERSACQLVEFADANNFEHIFLTRPGCGCGGLDWYDTVRPLLKNILDDRFTVVYQ